jgi:hypothetical protein
MDRGGKADEWRARSSMPRPRLLTGIIEYRTPCNQAGMQKIWCQNVEFDIQENFDKREKKNTVNLPA